MALTDWKADSGLVQLAPARGLWIETRCFSVSSQASASTALPSQAGGTRLFRLARKRSSPVMQRGSGKGALGWVLGAPKEQRWNFLLCVLKGAQAGSRILRATFLPTELSSNVLKIQLLHTLSELTQLLENWLLKTLEAHCDNLRKAGKSILSRQPEGWVVLPFQTGSF